VEDAPRNLAVTSRIVEAETQEEKEISQIKNVKVLGEEVKAGRDTEKQSVNRYWLIILF